MNKYLTMAAVLSVIAPPLWAQPPLQTEVVALSEAVEERVWDGNVEAVSRATISAQTSGRVAEILYDVDDYVGAGEVVIRFTSEEQAASLRQSRSLLAAAQADYQQAAAEYERIDGVFKDKLVSRSELDKALSHRDAARAGVEAAESTVAVARQRADYTTVRAPFAGIVTERLVELGEAVSPGKPLMTGISLERLRVTVELPQGLVEKVRQYGSAVVLSPVDGSRIAADRVTIFPYADLKSRTFKVRLALPESTPGLYPGMLVKAAFVVGRTARLSVPKTAIVQRSELTGVYLVEGDSITLRQVRVGRAVGDRFEILAGLHLGESIAIDSALAGVLLVSGGD